MNTNLMEAHRIFKIEGIEIEEPLLDFFISSVKSELLADVASDFYLQGKSYQRISRNREISEEYVYELIGKFQVIVIRSLSRWLEEQSH